MLSDFIRHFVHGDWTSSEGVEPRARFLTTVTTAGREVALWAEHVGEGAIMRAIGCIYLFAIPDVGLSRALDSLQDILDTYYFPPPQLPAPAHTTHRGKIGQSHRRRPLDLPAE